MSHHQIVYHPPSNACLKAPSSIVKTNKLLHSEFTVPAPTIKRSKLPSWTLPIFEPVNQEPSAIVNTLVSQLTKQYGKSYPWATGKGRQPPAGYILVKKTKAFQSGRPIISFVDSPFRPMPNIPARMITDWSSGQKAICCCKHWLKFKTAALNPSDPHWVLAGSLLHSLLPADLSVIAEGSLLNKVFPSKKEYHTQLKTGLHSWTKRNGLPSMPNQDISDLCHKMWTEHSKNVPLLPGHWQHLPRSVHLRTSFSRSSDDCHISCRPPATTTQQVISMGRRSQTTTPSGVHSGQTKEGVPKWATHHLFCWFSFSPYAQHPGQNDLSTYPSGLPRPLCFGRCIYSLVHLERSPCWWKSYSHQPRPGWLGILILILFSHQHWPGTIHWGLVHASGFPAPSYERCWQWSLLGLPGKIQ